MSLRIALPLLSMSLVCLALVGSSRVQPRSSDPTPTASPAGPAQATWAPPPIEAGYSNIHARDYVGPRTCGECHEAQYEDWQSHPHSVMNLDASEEAVLGDFTGVELAYGGGTARFEQEDASFFMTLQAGDERRRYRVTRTVGSRFTQMYVGVQVEGPEAAGHAIYEQEGKLPFGWWIGRGRWFPEVYFDSDCPPEYRDDGTLTLPPLGTHARASWTENCIFCHNTYPYEERLRAGRGATGYPEDDLELAGATTSAGLGLAPARLLRLGVSCESCHFGGREHAVHEEEIRFLPQSPALTVKGATPERVADSREWPYAINGICAQCHFSRGVSTYPDGSGTWNSREAVDQSLGACASAIKCTDCHDPHRAGPPGGSRERLREHVEACTSCHQELSDSAAAADHSQHPGQVSCLDCHMPRLVQGLESVVRSHRIRAAPDPRMLADGAPNACNLCHLDRSLSWTLAALRIGWGVDLQPQPEWEQAYAGGLEGSVGQAWLRARRPVTRLVATSAWSRSPLGQGAIRTLVASLRDPYAVNRMFALFAVERVLGRQIEPEEFDPTATPETREEQLQGLLRTLPDELR
jgi:hypothetical protein